MTDFHKEAYVNFVGYYMIVSGQKFLIQGFENKGVTKVTIPVQNLVSMLEKYYVDYMGVFSSDASYRITVDYRKEG